jgi:hypothetical protein
MEKKKVMLIAAGAAVLVAGYFGIKYLSKPKAAVPVTGTVASASTSGMITPAIGASAVAVVDGSNAPAGYGFNPSQNVYQWTGQGLPPNGAWTLPVS